MIGTITIITTMTVIASIIGTVTGFGLGTILTPIVLLLLPYPQTTLLVCIIHWFHNIFRVSFFHARIDWRLFIFFGIPSIIASFFGALLVTEQQSALLTSLFGLFLILTAMMLIFSNYIVISDNWFTGIIGGTISGFFAGLFGVRGAVRAIFLSSFDLHKITFLGTTAMISVLVDTTRLITYIFRDISLEASLLVSMMLFIPASYLGTYIGQKIVYMISQEKFRMMINIFLLLVGIKFLIAPWL